MKLPAKLKSLGKTILLKAKRHKKPKMVKPVKKNTWRRNLKAWDLRLDRRMQKRFPALVEPDMTERTCNNCGEHYIGRVCPQCGQAGSWSRYTFKQAILNFLDIWGLGNRPMFRTLHELFWRPGYMVRDYLQGHRQYYFPPFKLLAIVAVLVLFVNMFPGVEVDSVFSLFDINPSELERINFNGHSLHLSGIWLSVAQALKWFVGFLSKNMLYEWLFVGIIYVCCIWFGFRKVSKYNFVETYIFLIFMLAQNLLCAVPRYLGTALCDSIEAHGTTYLASGSSYVSNPVVAVFLSVAGIVSTLYALYVLFLTFLDFRQFYGLSWKSTLWHILLSLAIGLWAIVGVAVVSVALGTGDISLGIGLLLTFVLIPVAFIIAHDFLLKNNALINSKVRKMCKWAMLAVFYMIIIAVELNRNHVNLALLMALLLLYIVVTVVISLLPVVMYKKFHSTWLASLPLLLLIAWLVLITKIAVRWTA